MPGRQSKKHTYKYDSLYLNDGTHNLAEDAYHEVKPSYAGDLKYSAQSNDHNGWLKCDGRSISRTIYSKLFEVIGTSFGSNDAETFKLPDCRGRVLGTIGTGTGLTARTLGAMVGTETHTLTVTEMPSHSHTINDPGHSHNYVNNTNDQQVSALPGETAADQADLSATTGTSTTGITVNNTGGGGAHNNMQPTIFISNIFIFSR